MYCRKCGKYIEYNADCCKDCEEVTTYFDGKDSVNPYGAYNNPYGNGNGYNNPYGNSNAYGNPYNTHYNAPQPVGDRKEGFGKALASTILSSIAFFLIIIAFSMVSVALEEYSYGYYYDDYYSSTMDSAIVLAVLSLSMAIPSLIMGISSMKTFFRAKNAGRVKPVATLVLGIIGLATSALTLLYVLLVFAMSAL